MSDQKSYEGLIVNFFFTCTTVVSVSLHQNKDVLICKNTGGGGGGGGSSGGSMALIGQVQFLNVVGRVGGAYLSFTHILAWHRRH